MSSFVSGRRLTAGRLPSQGMPDMHESAISRAFFDRLADAAAQEVMPLFRAGIAVDNKLAGAFDPVTAADRQAELAMRAIIAATFPDHGILGEEYGSDGLEREHVWVLDPIDGTRSFIAGIPLWGTLIGLTRGGRAVMGMMAQPFTGERFFGDGGSADYAGPGGARALRTRPCARLSEATLFTTTPSLFSETERPLYDSLERAARLARYGADCYAYCMLAAGNVDLVVEAGLKPYDFTALIPIIEGAGGRITSWAGGPPGEDGRVLAAGDARLHEEVLKRLSA